MVTSNTFRNTHLPWISATSSHQGLNKWIIASLVSKELNLSIQTVTNSLKELETHGILYSKKEGRKRKYFLQDPDNFSKAFYQSIHLMQSNRMKGRYFPLQILLDELGRELRRLSMKDSRGLEGTTRC